MQSNTEKQIVDLIKRSKKILILPSAPPDGDSIGSALALYLALKKLNKDITVICSDPVPEVLQFLPNMKIIGNKSNSSKDFIITVSLEKSEMDALRTEKEGNKLNIILTPKSGSITEDDISFNKSKADYDLIIVVDSGELKQLKNFYENNPDLFTQIPVINIDHHISNVHFGKINHVDIMASSTTELILPILELMAEEEGINIIDEDIATLLLTGIITDTGSFQNANTTPKAFAKAARLVSYGARQQEIIQHIYKTKQLSQLKLWGRVLSKIQTDDKYRIVWSAVSQQDFRDTESSEDQTGDIIDELMTNAPGAEVVLLIKEKTEGAISVSVRTTNASIDSSRIAEHFGGGGHAQASGFRMDNLSLRDAEYEVIKFVREFQKERLGIIEEKTREEEVDTAKPEPIINVEELLARANSAQKASEAISSAQEKTTENSPNEKTKKKEKKIPASKKKEEKIDSKVEDITPGVIYKFED